MKQWLLKNNFSSGEISPLLYTRTEIQQYSNGAKQLKNMLPLVEGGVKRRGGTRLITTFGLANNPARHLRLIPFVAESNKAFLLVITTDSIAVINPRTNATVFNQSSSPWNTPEKLKSMSYAQTRYRMMFVQRDTPVQRLITSADYTTWQFGAFAYSTEPNDDNGTSLNVALTPSGVDVGQSITLTAAAYPNWSNTVTYLVGDRVISGGNFFQALVQNVNIAPPATATSNTTWQNISAAAAGVFSAANVGDVVEVNSGIVQITQFNSASVVTGEVRVKLASQVQAIARSWVLKSKAFSVANGYPQAVAFFKQRLVFANTKTSPNQMWFSAIADDGNFLETTKDADAFSIASSSNQSDNILHLAQRGGVVALCGGAEFLVSSDGPLTPSSAQITEHTSYGAQPDVKPVRVGNELLFVQRGGERLRALSYRFEVNGLVSDELSIMASHIGKAHDGIVEMTFMQEPNSLVWILLADGKLATLTLNRDQQLTAWAEHDLGARVISICSLPSATGSDEMYFMVQRGSFAALEIYSEAKMMDCCNSFPFTGGVATAPTAIEGFYSSISAAYLNETGFYYSDIEVSSIADPNFKKLDLGQDITQNVDIGQAFECIAEMLPPSLADAPSTLQHHKVTVKNIVLYMNNSVGGTINDSPIETKTADQSAFQNLPYSGYAETSIGGWQLLRDLQVTLKQDKPLPFHVQAVSMLTEVNDR